MSWQSKALFIGAHFWFAPAGAAFTVPGVGTVTQNGTWPGGADPNWPSWALGPCESFELDPKLASSDIIMAPSPGLAVAVDEITPYAVPEISFTIQYTDALAPQLALNTQALWNTGTSQWNPNGSGNATLKGILQAQAYDQNNNLILSVQSWVCLKLKSGLKGALKTMTKPEYTATILYSPNNTGSC